ncbi:MAG: metallophosphoesterase [Ignavibacteria bacterium]|nr:metallophosphoesterase [Ignavibacteria bacterium]
MKLQAARHPGSAAHGTSARHVCALLLLLPLFLSPVIAQPRLSFGVVADVQWSDKDKSGAMDYRSSLGSLQRCVDALALEKLSFIVQLGDFIDGWEKDAVRSAADVDTVLKVFNRLKGMKVHVAGNHCYRATPTVLLKKWKLKKLYYDFAAAGTKGWRFIVLDGNDAGYGVISPAQVDWLKKILAAAVKKKERVVVFCHFPLLREASPNHRLNNPELLLPVLEGSGCVVAYIAGHDHAGGYTEQKGIHHITVRALVENAERTTYAVMNLHDTKLVEHGFGAEPVRSCVFGAIIKEAK